MAVNLLRFVNRGGIPCLETVGVELTTSAETFSFNSHHNIGMNFQGLFAVKVSGTPTAPGTAVPINFTTIGVNGSTVPVYTASGAALTTANWPGNGVYLFWYDRTTNITRLMSVV